MVRNRGGFRLLISLQDAEITCTTSGNNQVIVCDSYGCIHLFNRNWDVITYKAHDSAINLCELLHHHNLLITVGVSRFRNSVVVR